MKKFTAIIVLLAILFTTATGAHATEPTAATTICYTEDLGNGFAMETVLVISDSIVRSNTRTAEKQRTFTYKDNVIAIIAITGTFSYNGTSCSVISKSISRLDTYSGWSLTQTYFSSEGGAIALVGELNKFLYPDVPVSFSLVCDNFGNVS